MNGTGHINACLLTLGSPGGINITPSNLTNFEFPSKKSIGQYILTHGYELHCNAQANPNNLEVTFPKPNAKTGFLVTFHMDRLQYKPFHKMTDRRYPLGS